MPSPRRSASLVWAAALAAAAACTGDGPRRRAPVAEAGLPSLMIAQSIEAPALPMPRPPDVPTLEDPSGTALEPFVQALAQTEAGGAVTRVLHMGDSSIGLDGLPHALRRRMQDRFGDAGPGFVLLGRYSANYKSKVVHIEGSGWDICYLAYLCRADGHYGLGGHIFQAVTGARTVLRPPGRAGHGRRTSRAELWYAAHPRGGRIQMRVDREPWIEVETRSERLEDRWLPLEMVEGEHRIEVRAAGHGVTRAYGVVLENDGPGVVWDTVSMIGAFTKRLHGFDSEHIRRQIAHRDPDLLVLGYGGNDLRRFVTGSVDGEGYAAELARVLEALRPGARPACLVVGVIDHGRSGRQSVRPEHVEALVQAQRQVALEHGCAFFDAAGAMGGPGAIHAWREQGLAEPDLKHLSHRGRERMGQMIFDALMHVYEARSERGRGGAPP